MFNLFSTLKIGEKENIVSNLLAYWFDYNQTKNLEALNVLLKIAGLDVVKCNEIEIIREKPISKKENRYDIIILIGKIPDRVICIENKINASEGHNQTKRYYDEIESRYSNVKTREYIFLAKDNGCLKLSDPHFKHVKYMDYAKELDKISNKKNLVGLEDFVQYYWKSPQAHYSRLATQSVKDPEEFVDYLVWYINQKKIGTLSMRGFSEYHSADKKYQIDLKEWSYHNGLKEITMNIHFEGNISEGLVHYETFPYMPYDKFDDAFKQKYIKERDALRARLKVHYPEKLRENASLSLCKIKLKGATYKEVADEIIKTTQDVKHLILTLE